MLCTNSLDKDYQRDFFCPCCNHIFVQVCYQLSINQCNVTLSMCCPNTCVFVCFDTRNKGKYCEVNGKKMMCLKVSRFTCIYMLSDEIYFYLKVKWFKS